jgi:hypothetical protein
MHNKRYVYTDIPHHHVMARLRYILSNGYRGQSGRDVKLTPHTHLVPRLRMRTAIHPLPQHFMAWFLVKNLYVNRILSERKQHSTNNRASRIEDIMRHPEQLNYRSMKT